MKLPLNPSCAPPVFVDTHPGFHCRSTPIKKSLNNKYKLAHDYKSPSVLLVQAYSINYKHSNSIAFGLDKCSCFLFKLLCKISSSPPLQQTCFQSNLVCCEVLSKSCRVKCKCSNKSCSVLNFLASLRLELDQNLCINI